jgi:hypothetical protein
MSFIIEKTPFQPKQTPCQCGRANSYGNITICYLCMRDVKDPQQKICLLCNVENIPFYQQYCYKCICGGCGDRNIPGSYICEKHKCSVEGCKEAAVKHHITDLCNTHTCKRVACFNITTTDNGYCCEHDK